MLRLVLAVLTLTAGLSVAAAETPPSIAPGVPSGSGTQPVAVYGADGKVVSFPDPARIRVTTMPFQRLHSLPIRLKALGTTPKVFPIARPADARPIGWWCRATSTSACSARRRLTRC